jgi:hypothetical protein
VAAVIELLTIYERERLLARAVGGKGGGHAGGA